METKTKSSEWKRGYQAAKKQIELRQNFLLKGAASKIYGTYLYLLQTIDDIECSGYRVSDYTRGQVACYEELFSAR